MKKTMKAVAGLMMIAAVALMASCGNKAEEIDTKASTPAATTELKIAYVLIDSLTSQYQRCKDLEEEFAKKRANAEKTVNEKGKAFANQVQDFQRKVQQNQYTQDQYNAEQARLGKLQQDIEALNARLSNSLQEDYQKEFQALTDTIQNFTKTFAKKKGYDFILCKSSGIDNVLYADEKYDVTEEVVAALNKLYNKDKKSAPKKEAKAEEEKK